jgi:hypothetical protein
MLETEHVHVPPSRPRDIPHRQCNMVDPLQFEHARNLGEPSSGAQASNRGLRFSLQVC